MTGGLLVDLLRSQCRFAVGEDDRQRHLFCAEPVEEPGASYCAAHAAVCFDRRSAEKRDRDAEVCASARLRRTGAQVARSERTFRFGRYAL